MGKALIDIPDELHWTLKQRAAYEHIPLKQLIAKVVVGAMERYLRENPPSPTLFDQAYEKQKRSEGGS